MASVALKSVGTNGGLPVNVMGAYEVTFAVEANGAKGELVVSVPTEGEMDTDVVMRARELLQVALLALANMASRPEPMVAGSVIPF